MQEKKQLYAGVKVNTRSGWQSEVRSSSMAFKTAEHIENDNVIITVEVIAEVVYVLLKVYSLEREKISEVVINFVELVHCHEHDEVVLALAKFEKSNPVGWAVQEWRLAS